MISGLRRTGRSRPLPQLWRRGRLAPVLLAALALLCCGDPEEVLSPKTEPLYVEASAEDFADNPELLDRILSSPHGYLRFINLEFSSETCRLFADTLDEVPIFNLHGDAHIEQYAVTDLGRGLTDFDDSSTGPAIVDLIRVAVSLEIAARLNGWQGRASEIVDRFLAGYRDALADPETEAPVPAVVERLESEFEYDRGKYFEWVKSIVDPVPAAEATSLVSAMGPYVEAMVIEHPEIEPSFFEIVDVGYLRLGIGSALDRKYLIRIQGSTVGPDDDLVLELKQVRDLSGIDCISIAKRIDPQRILRGQARIAYQPYRFLGYVRFDGLTFWIHAWVDNYTESSVESTFGSPEELSEVAYDIGVQLGRGHPKITESSLAVQLRNDQLRLLDRDDARIKQIAATLTDRVVLAWEAFRSQVG